MEYLKKSILLVWAGVFAFTGCSLNSDPGQGTMQVRLTDNPADYEEVNVDIQRVEVHYQDGEQSRGWITISDEAMQVNLLELVNGADTLLGEAQLDAGTYKQLRLILGSENTLVANGSTQNLTVPSGQQTGIKLQIDAEIEADQTYTLLLDFDASRSIVNAGNSGQHLLNPVIRTVELSQTGAIAGDIDPLEAASYVFTVAGEDTISTYADNETGEFKLIGVPDGEYTVTAISGHGDYDDNEVSDIHVMVGETTDVGTITLPQK